MGTTFRVARHLDFFHFRCDIEDRPFSQEYIVSFLTSDSLHIGTFFKFLTFKRERFQILQFVRCQLSRFKATIACPFDIQGMESELSGSQKKNCYDRKRNQKLQKCESWLTFLFHFFLANKKYCRCCAILSLGFFSGEKIGNPKRCQLLEKVQT